MSAPLSPGWYPAPDGQGEQWWNGAGWSEGRRNPDGTTPGLPGYQAAPPPGPPAATAPPVPGPVPLGAPNPYPGVSAVGASGPAKVLTSPALIGLIFGVLSLVVFAPLGVVGIVLGIVGLRKTAPAPAGARGMSIGAIVLGAIGLVIGLVQLILFFAALASSFTVSLT